MLHKKLTQSKEEIPIYHQENKGQQISQQRTVSKKLVKPFRCQFCDRTFSGRHNWHIHERRHTGEKPFNCRYCMKAFASSNGKVLHERLHTGEKPYKCGACGKAYSDSSNRKKHQALCKRKHAKT